MSTTTDPNDPGLSKIDSKGMQEKYLVLSPEERAKGFVRPLRRSYRHVACGTDTRMGDDLAETYAREPGFYSGTYCASCQKHFPLTRVDKTPAFVWVDDGEAVGS